MLAATPAIAAATGTISGTVIDTDTAAPIAGITAEAYAYDAGLGAWDWVGDAVTGASGTYAIAGLAPGTYRVGFFDHAVGRYRGQYYSGATSVLLGSDVVVVDAATTPGIDGALAALPLAFSGTVTDSGSGAGIPGVEIALFDESSGAWAESLYYAYTADDGTWALYGTPAGTYRFRFTDGAGQYATEFFDGVATVDVGTSRTWDGSTAQTGIDATMAELPAMLLGSITDTGAAPIPGAEVTAYEYDSLFSAWIPVAWGIAEADGSWGLAVADGTYRIGAHDASGEHLDRYHVDSADVTAADSVPVAGSPVSGIDISMPVALPSAMGTVVDMLGDPIEGVEVVGWRYSSAEATWLALSTMQTAADGSFLLRGLGDGAAIASFSDPFGRYAAEYWSDKTNADNADTYFVSTVDTTDLGVVALADLPVSISGTVTSADTSAALAGVDVTCWTYDPVLADYMVERWTQSAADGSYELRGLVDGDHFVSFEDPSGDYLAQWYDGAAEFVDALAVSTAAGSPVAGVDAVMQPAPAFGSLAGTVTAAVDGAAVEGASVVAYGWNPVAIEWQAVASVSSAADGSYVLTGLPAGNYRVKAGDGGVNHRDRYFADASTLASATDVAVPENATATAGIALPLWAHVSGVVTDEGTGAPLEGVSVTLYRSVGGVLEVFDFTDTAADGSYGFYRLPSDVYVVEFFDPTDAYAPEYYDNRTAADFADPLGAGGVLHLSGIDAALAARAPAAVSGSVTDSGTGLPLTGATVTLYDASSSAVVKTVQADDLGYYAFLDLADGTYRVGASAPGYSTVYFDGSATLGAASDLVYAAPARLSGTDIALVDLPPTVTSDAKAAYVETATISLVASDGIGPGIESVSYRVDGGATVTVAGASANVVVTGLGSHLVQFWATDLAGGVSQVYSASFTVSPNRVTRIGGASRYDVAAATADRYPDDILHVVLASGDSAASADPLAAAGLSWAYGNVPIVLVTKSGTPDSTSRHVEGLALDAASRDATVVVHIVGGAGSVPDARFSEIKSFIGGRNGASVANRVVKDRILSTGDRYDMAAAVAGRMDAVRGAEMPGFALIANGENPNTFFDALSLAPVSAHNGAPILLVRGGSVPRATSSRLDALGITGGDTYIAGGPGTVSEAVRVALGTPVGNRLAGSTRYSTAAAIADKALSAGWLGATDVGLAAKIPDALAGGAYLGYLGGPMLVTTTQPLHPDAERWISDHAGTIDRVWVFGGTASITSPTAAQANAALIP